MRYGKIDTGCLRCGKEAHSNYIPERGRVFYACHACGFQWFGKSEYGNVLYQNTRMQKWLLTEPGLLAVFQWEEA